MQIAEHWNRHPEKLHPGVSIPKGVRTQPGQGPDQSAQMGSSWFTIPDWRPLGVPSNLHESVTLQAWPHPLKWWSLRWSLTSHKVPQPIEVPSQVYFQTLLFMFPISLFYFPSYFFSEIRFCSLVHTDQRTDTVHTDTANLTEVSALQTSISAAWCTVDLCTSHSSVTVLAKVLHVWLGQWGICTSVHTMWRSSSVRRWMNEEY